MSSNLNWDDCAVDGASAAPVSATQDPAAAGDTTVASSVTTDNSAITTDGNPVVDTVILAAQDLAIASKDVARASTRQPLNGEWMASLFPSKDEEKRQKWLSVLLDNEFEYLDELSSLNDSVGWDSLSFPLAIKTTLQKALQDHLASTAENDSGFAAVPAGSLQPLTQLDCIVMDISRSMRARSNIDVDKTREDMSKLLFHTMMDKMVGLELNHAVGLLAFGETVSPIGITREYERFHDELGRLDANQNRTKLYDAIYEAAQMLDSYAQQHVPEHSTSPIVRRVFVLTDGQDNASDNAAWHVAQYLQQKNVVLDAIPVGGANKKLHALAKASGGLCFDVVSQEQGMALFEREAVLHLAYREEAPKPEAIDSLESFSNLEKAIPLTAVVDVKSAAPKMLQAKVLDAATIEKRVADLAAAPAATSSAAASSSSSSSSSSSRSAAALKRVMKEYQGLSVQPVGGWSAYVNADNMLQWKLVMRGPPDSFYEGGSWLLTVEFPTEYPLSPPRVRFVTPVFHTNISNDGRICLDILKESWNPTITISKVMLSIHALLVQPNIDDPLDAWKATLLKDDPAQYESQCRASVANNAMEDLAAKYNL